MQCRSAALGIAVLFAAMSPNLFGNAPQYPDVKIVQSTSTSVTFEYTPKYTADGTIVAAGRDFKTVSFHGNSDCNFAELGKPDIRFRSVTIGVRGRANNTVTVIGSKASDEGGFLLAPVPKIVGTNEQNPSGRIYAPAPATTDEFYPATLAVGRVAKVKGVFVCYVRIFPVQYNSATRTLRRYSTITVKVDFGPAEASMAPAGDDDWMKTSFLNYSSARTFSAGVPTLARRTATNSVLSTGSWYKLEVKTDGIYKIDATYLRSLGIDPSSVQSMTDLKIYGGNGLAIPAELNQPRQPDLTLQPAWYVDVNGNSKFDSNDYILFYGQGVTGWTYTSSAGYSHYTNPYTNSSYYFLQYAPGSGSGKQMSVVSGPSSGARVTTAVGKVFFDEERTNFNASGLNWYSAPFNPGDTRVITNKLDGYVPGTFVHYAYEMLSRSDVTGTFSLEETGAQIGSLYISGATESELADPTANYAHVGDGSTQAVPTLSDNRSTLKVTYNAPSTIATGYINWIEITYRQQLTAVGNSLLFNSPDTTGAVQYELTGFVGSNFAVFDVTDPLNVKRMQFDSDQVAGSFAFRDNLVRGSVKRYWAGVSAGYGTPASSTRIPNSNLRGATTGADFVIITHHDFVSEAQRLKTYKESLPNGNALSTYVVEVDTIYNEFGNGMPDPASIRDFLYYAVSNWTTPPRYVLFFGDADFDYKNILGVDRDWVPTCESPESNNQVDTYSYDDFFTYLNPGDDVNVSVAHGRLAVRSSDEARLAVDRIIQYETAIPLGAWKNLITIVCDDQNINGAIDDAPNPVQAELLAENYVPKSYNIKKIYEPDYPTVIASTGRTKPQVRQAIIDQVNAGTLVLNYTGHGNPNVWSHETILTKDDVINQFFNQNDLTCIVAATCDWGRFDQAGTQSSAEEAMRNPRGGAIAVVSSTRAVWSDSNFLINTNLYSFLFPTDLFARTPRLGDALMMAKNQSGDLENDRKYHLLGDPTLRLAVPKLVMQIDSINGFPVSQSTFDTLQALSKVRVSASIRDGGGNVQNLNSDSSLITVYDSDLSDSTYDSEVQIPFVFLKPGATIYNGQSTIRNGWTSATFVVPKDISYGNKQGKVSMYFSGAGTDGRGYTDRVVVGGTATSVANDTQGPSVEIYFDTRTFRSGDLVNENPLLIVDLADSSGINSAGSSVGHRIEAWLDGDSKSIDLTSNYQGAKDNYQAGTVLYQMEGLGAGLHTLKVRAWDVYNNSTSTQTEFSVASSSSLALEDVFNIPNPMRSSTTFTFQHNQLAPIYAEIKIFTVTGRLIQVIPENIYNDRFVKIFWDGLDRDGSKIANGTYFYKVIARTVDGKYSNEALGKLAIVR
ncbi:MAG TPA: type IX secretion system sortase PorU [Bacteroidota bacterium]|nr:type IX secretion system sortase PorU [Bacteroidota bacterium]